VENAESFWRYKRLRLMTRGTACLGQIMGSAGRLSLQDVECDRTAMEIIIPIARSMRRKFSRRAG